MDPDAEPASRPDPAPGIDPGLERGLVQSLIWSAAACLELGLFSWLVRPLQLSVAAALVSVAAAGLFAQLLRWRDTPRMRLTVMSLWAGLATLACGLTGGLSGPLGALTLAPLLFVFALDRPRLLPSGAALSWLSVALALGVALSGVSSPPRGAVAAWLALLGAGLVVGALSFVVTLAYRRRALESDGASAALHRVEALLAAQPHLILTVSAEGRMISAFGSAPPGLTADMIADQGLIGVAHHPDRAGVQSALLQAATHGRGEIDFTPRSALDRRVNLAATRLDDKRLVAVLADVSLQHAREAAIDAARSQAEALNAGKSRFLANMSHELRTPLNAVLGFSDIMRQKLFGPIPDRYAEYAQLIHESGGHLLDLINDVLDMSKIEAARYELHKETFDAREPVSAALRLVRLQAHEAGITLRGVLPSEELIVEADRRALKQITLNLLSNALKFTPSNGAVTVTVSMRAEVLELAVADSGVGVAAEDLERIGRPFEQAGDMGARTLGTGLGLSLVRAFAQLHGGEMNIESVLGEGTCVTVRLPVARGAGANGGRGGAEIIPLDARR